jgi:hypothetical protein
MKLPIRFEEIPWEGTWFYDADGKEVTPEEIVEYINGTKTTTPSEESA